MSKLPKAVVILGVVSLLTDVSSEMILPLLPALLIGTMGATPMIIGLLDGIADALSALLRLWAGRLSDRSPRRKPFVLAGYTLSTVVRPLMGIALAPWQVLAIRAVDRVGKAFRSAPRDALIADAVPAADAPRAYAFHRAMDHTGAILGPLVAFALLSGGLDAREAILCAWIPGALAVLALMFIKEKPREIVAPTAGPGPAPGSTPANRLLVVIGIFSLGVLADSFILVRAREVGVSDALLPVIWSVLHVAKVFAASAVAKMNVASHGLLAIAWCVVAVGIGLLIVDVIWIPWLAAVLLGIGHGAREPFEKSLVRAHASDAARGRAFGAYHLVTGLLSLPAGLTIGGLWSTSGGATLALAVSLALVIVAAIALAFVRPSGTVQAPS